MNVPQYCPACGTALTNGVCTTCPVKMYNPPVQPPATPSTTPIPPTAPAPPAATPQPVQWGQSQGQWGPQGQWNAGAAWGAPAAHGPGARFIGMWNWGAFLLCPFWLMNHGRIGRGILYIVLGFIPVVGLVTIAMAIAYGIKGNEVAATSRYFHDDAQFVAVQNAWRNWGIGVTAVAIVFVVIAAIGGAMSTGTRSY